MLSLSYLLDYDIGFSVEVVGKHPDLPESVRYNVTREMPVFMDVQSELIVDKGYHKYMAETNAYFTNGYE